MPNVAGAVAQALKDQSGFTGSRDSSTRALSASRSNSSSLATVSRKHTSSHTPEEIAPARLLAIEKKAQRKMRKREFSETTPVKIGASEGQRSA